MKDNVKSKDKYQVPLKKNILGNTDKNQDEDIPLIQDENNKLDKNDIASIKVESKNSLIKQEISSYKYQIADTNESKRPVIISLDQLPNYKSFFITVHPFIINGYRIHHSLTRCFTSLFTLHNETMNVWTHLIPFFVFLGIFIYNLTSNTFKYHMIIYLFLFTTFLFLLFSSIHHTFNCHSNEVWRCCYKMDILGIMFQLLTATLCSFQFMFHDYDELRKIYCYSFLALGCCTMILSMFDFFISAKLNIFLMLAYASLFVISFLSSVHWVAIANFDEVESISGYVLMSFAFIFVGFSIFLAKFPECVVQHKFIDYFFNSHIIWHLCCVGSATCYYMMLSKYYLLISDA